MNDNNENNNGKILVDAHKLINGAREYEYGTPGKSFDRIAKLWSIYLDVDLSSRDVPCMMALLKIGREAYAHKQDNLIDAAGYIGLAGDMPDSCIRVD